MSTSRWILFDGTQASANTNSHCGKRLLVFFKKPRMQSARTSFAKEQQE
jgi:hypothetical protein